METKLVRVPFDAELAKKIQNGEVKGKIVTRDNRNVRIVCFDKKSNSCYNIVALVDMGSYEEVIIYRVTGIYTDSNEEENDLFLEVPIPLTLKDGDIVAFDDGDMIAIIKGDCKISERGEYCYETYTVTNLKNEAVFLKHPIITNEARLATKEEKQKLIDDLKSSTEPRAKEYLKRFFGIEEKSEPEQIEEQEHEFKPFDKVIVRDSNDEIWRVDFFSHMEDDLYECIGAYWKQCIPYEGNKHLLGTTNNPKNKRYEEFI